MNKRLWILLALALIASGCSSTEMSTEKTNTPKATTVTKKEETIQVTGQPDMHIPRVPQKIASIEDFELDLEFILGRIINNSNLDPAFGYIEKEDFDKWVERIEENETKRDILLPLYAKLNKLIHIEKSTNFENPFDDVTYRDAFVAFHNQLVMAETELWNKKMKGELDDNYIAYEHLFSGYWINLETTHNSFSGEVTFSVHNKARNHWGTLWEYQDYYMNGGAYE